MKYYPTGRRNQGRPLKRLLYTWDRNGSTSGPTPWQIYDDDDDDDDDDESVIGTVFFPSNLVSSVIIILQKLYTHLSQALYSISKWQR